MSASANSCRVLVVDDDAVIRQAVVNLFDRLGYPVTDAEGSAAAFDLASREHYDLVVSDFDMPVLNGYQLACCIKREDAGTKEGTQAPPASKGEDARPQARQEREETATPAVERQPVEPEAPPPGAPQARTPKDSEVAPVRKSAVEVAIDERAETAVPGVPEYDDEYLPAEM